MRNDRNSSAVSWGRWSIANRGRKRLSTTSRFFWMTSYFCVTLNFARASCSLTTALSKANSLVISLCPLMQLWVSVQLHGTAWAPERQYRGRICLTDTTGRPPYHPQLSRVPCSDAFHDRVQFLDGECRVAPVNDGVAVRAHGTQITDGE